MGLFSLSLRQVIFTNSPTLQCPILPSQSCSLSPVTWEHHPWQALDPMASSGTAVKSYWEHSGLRTHSPAVRAILAAPVCITSYISSWSERHRATRTLENYFLKVYLSSVCHSTQHTCHLESGILQTFSLALPLIPFSVVSNSHCLIIGSSRRRKK